VIARFKGLSGLNNFVFTPYDRERLQTTSKTSGEVIPDVALILLARCLCLAIEEKKLSKH